MQNEKSVNNIPPFMAENMGLFTALYNVESDVSGVIRRLKKEEKKLQKHITKYLSIYSDKKLANHMLVFNNIKQRLFDLVSQTYENATNAIFKKGVKQNGR